MKTSPPEACPEAATPATRIAGRPIFQLPTDCSPINFHIYQGPNGPGIGQLVLSALNAELTKKALEKVGNPNILINLVSRRVRQLNMGGGGMGRPLIDNADNLGAADIALREIIEGKIGWELPEPVSLVRTPPKKRKRH